jgi:hypothetical protein
VCISLIACLLACLLACLFAGLFACPEPGMLPCHSRVSRLTWLQPAQVTGCHGQVRFRGFLRLVALRRRPPIWVCKIVQTGFADVCTLGLNPGNWGIVFRSSDIWVNLGNCGFAVQVGDVMDIIDVIAVSNSGNWCNCWDMNSGIRHRGPEK